MTNLPAPKTAAKSLAKVSPLQLYLQEVAKYPLLTPEEEYELAVSHFDDKDVEAAHRLVTSNLRLVVKIASDFRNSQASFLDLIQEGNHGLMQAVKKFNPYKGVKLSSYAAWWIRAYILKFIMDNASQVRIGTTAAQRKLFYNLRKETERLLREYDEVDTKLLAERLDVREKDVVEMQKRLGSPDVSLDAPLAGRNGESDDSRTIGSLLTNDEPSVEDEIAFDQVKRIFDEHLQEYIQTLKDRDLEIFNARIMAEEPKTLQEIGDLYGITRERARQIEARLIRNLKKYVESKGQLIDI